MKGRLLAPISRVAGPVTACICFPVLDVFPVVFNCVMTQMVCESISWAPQGGTDKCRCRGVQIVLYMAFFMVSPLVSLLASSPEPPKTA